MAGKDMSAQRMTMIRFGLGLGLLIYFLFNVYLEDTNKLYKDITAEVNASKLLMDVERWQEVTRNTEKTFNYLFVELNITAYLNKTLLPEDDKTKPARGMNLAANKFMSPSYTAARNIPLMVYQAIYRWYLLAGWFFTFLPPDDSSGTGWLLPVENEEICFWRCYNSALSPLVPFAVDNRCFDNCLSGHP
ncbi:hypothetical protein AB8S79_22960 [Klebsiella pneumoniae]